MTATPTRKIRVIVNFKNGSSTTYENVEFFPSALFLLFNGGNAGAEVVPDSIQSLSIENKQYFLKDSEVENGVLKIWIRE